MQWLLHWLLGDEKTFEASMNKQPLRTLGKLVLAGLVATLAAVAIALAVAWAIVWFGPKEKIASEPYFSTQTAYQVHPDNQPSFIDLNGRGRLFIEITKTLEAAILVGKEKGEEGKIYTHDVVAMVFDPAETYSVTPSGKSEGVYYVPENLYFFYLKDEKKRVNIIASGGRKYKVTLLRIDGPNIGGQWNYGYTFRVEEEVD